MTRTPLLALYSLAHFWVDLSCALLAFRSLSASLLADRLDRNGAVAAAGCALVALAYAVPLPLAAAVTAGVGNALFHLGGGIDTLNTGLRRSAALGIFVSPGAVGLFLGTLWGRGDAAPLWAGPVGLLVLAGAILWLCRRTFGSLRSGNAPVEAEPAGGSWLPLVPLFLVVVLRQGQWALVLTLALALGKAGGGLLSDRLGPRRAAGGSLLLAAALYLLSDLPLAGTAAVFLFNMTMPLTLWAAARALPGARGFSFGLLTFGLFVGCLPSFLGWSSLLTGPWAYAAAALLSLALLWRPMGKEAALC